MVQWACDDVSFKCPAVFASAAAEKLCGVRRELRKGESVAVGFCLDPLLHAEEHAVTLNLFKVELAESLVQRCGSKEGSKHCAELVFGKLEMQSVASS